MRIKFTEIVSHQLFACFFFKTISQVCLVAACLKKSNAVWIGNAVGCTQKIVGIKESRVKKKVFIFIFLFILFGLQRIMKQNCREWIYFGIYLYMFSHFP